MFFLIRWSNDDLTKTALLGYLSSGKYPSLDNFYLFATAHVCMWGVYRQDGIGHFCLISCVWRSGHCRLQSSQACSGHHCKNYTTKPTKGLQMVFNTWLKETVL